MDETEPTPDTPDRTCGNCGMGMQRHQDWCLECGTAAPGRLGGLRPGWRAVSTTLALTLVLVGGAGAASYAALSSDANREAMASTPLDGTPVAQAPPAVPAPAAPVDTVPAIPVTPAPAVTTPPTKLPVAPKVATVPTTTPAPVAPTVTPTTPTTTDSSSRSTSPPKSTSTAAGDRGEGTSADGGSSKTATAKLTPIPLTADELSVYDPYKRSVSPGDPADAVDGDTQTTFEIGAPDDGKEIQVGVVVDLGTAKQVRGVQFTTTTPGGRVEIYATDGSALPPDVLDTRWDHPASRSDVDGGSVGDNKAGDGVERLVFPKGGAKYRYVTLWFTTPPEGTTRVGLTELKILH